MKKIKNVDLAYTAGMIDSDGCIAINRSHKGYRHFCPWVQIAQIDSEGLKYIEKIFNFLKYSNFCKDNKRKFHRLLIVGSKCQIILKQILPYLKIKKKQALIVIKLCKLIDNRYKTKIGKGKDTRKMKNSEICKRYNLYKQIRKLNSR